jgi:hypothetical protein
MKIENKTGFNPLVLRKNTESTKLIILYIYSSNLFTLNIRK